MDSSFLTNLRQSLPDYLVSSLILAGVTSLDVFLALSESRATFCDVIPLAEVVSYLREQLPLFTSRDQIRAYLPQGLCAAEQDLETARRQAEHWSVPPGARYLLFRVQADLRAQVEALELTSDTVHRLANLPFSVSPRPQRSATRQRWEPPDCPPPARPSPAKMPRLEPAALPEACGDVTITSVEENEGGKRRRTRKRARRSKNPPAAAPASTAAAAPVPESSTAVTPVPVSRQAPRPSPGPSAPPPASARLGHVIFDSDGEVTEERQPMVHPRAIEAAQNRRTCKSRPSFQLPEMSKEAQLKSRQTNRSFFLKNDGSAPEIPAYSLRKQPAPVSKIQDTSSPSAEPQSRTPPKKKFAPRGPKIVNVDLDKESSSSSSSSSESEPEPKPSRLRRNVTQEVMDTSLCPGDSKDASHSPKGPQDASVSHQGLTDVPCSYEDPKDIPCVIADPFNGTLSSHKDNDASEVHEDIPPASPGPGEDTSVPPSHRRDTHSPLACNGSQMESVEAADAAVPAKCSIVIPRDYSLLETIRQPPQEGSLIAFKILELDPNSFTPEVSDFKEGRFLSFDRAKRRCQIEVLVNKRISVGEGKFDVWMESSDGQVLTNFEEEEETLVTSWDSLQAVKLISGPPNDSC